MHLSLKRFIAFALTIVTIFSFSSTDMVMSAETRASGYGISWNSVTYGNGLFVAVSAGIADSQVMTSVDGTNWTRHQTPGADQLWSSVTYGNGLFVAVSNGGGTSTQVMTSHNGINWTLRSTPGENQPWNAVTYGNGMFVAVAGGFAIGSQVMTSHDGINWTLRSTPGISQSWSSVTYASGLFVSVSSWGIAGNQVMTSPNGMEWTLQETPGISQPWSSVTYGNGMFVAVSSWETMSSQVMTSPNGIHWTPQETPGVGQTWRSIAYGDGMFVAVSDWTTAESQVMISYDGTNWELLSIQNEIFAMEQGWSSVIFHSNEFLLVSSIGDTYGLGVATLEDLTTAPPRHLGNLPVGQTIRLMHGGELRNFIIVQQGSPGLGYVGFENVTLVMEERSRELHSPGALTPLPPGWVTAPPLWDLWRRQMHNVDINDYQNSGMHNWLNDFYLSIFDDSIIDHIKEVRIPFSPGAGAIEEIRYGEEGLLTRIFLPSKTELGLVPMWGNPVFRPEGIRFDYFLEGTSEEALQRRQFRNEGNHLRTWWTRSPISFSMNDIHLMLARNFDELGQFGVVQTNGNNDNGVQHPQLRATLAHGIRPAIPLSSSLIVLENGEIYIPEDIPESPPSLFSPPPPDPTPLREMPIGRIVRLSYNGTMTDFVVIHQGNPGEQYIGFEEVTILMPLNTLGYRQMNNTHNNSYADSTMHTWLNDDFLNYFAEDIRNHIVQVRIPYRPGSGLSREVAYGENGLLTRPFLMSRVEVTSPSANHNSGMLAHMPHDEGSVFDFFLNAHNNFSTNRRRSAFSTNLNHHGRPELSLWYLRTPSTNIATSFWRENSSTASSNPNPFRTSSATQPFGIRPAIPVSSSLVVLHTGEVAICDITTTPPPVISPPTTPPTLPTPEPVPLGEIPVGEVVKLSYNGVMTSFIVIQQGNPGSMYVGFEDATVVMPYRVLETRAMGYTSQWFNNRYEQSEIHVWLNSEFMEMFDDNIQENMLQVRIPYRPSYTAFTSRVVNYGANGLLTSPFLLSLTEVGIPPFSNTPTDEGSRFDFFLDNSMQGANLQRIAYFWNSQLGVYVPASWFLRTPRVANTIHHYVIMNNQGDVVTNSPLLSLGIRPAIPLSSSLMVLHTSEVVAPDTPPTQPLNGWQLIDDNWYLYDNNTRLLGWQQPHDDDRWFFLDYRLDGAMLTGIVTLPGGDVHEFAANGVWIGQIHNRDGWLHIDNNWFLYDNNTRLYGWQIPQGDTRWFFLDYRLNNGAMVTGIVTLPGGDTHEFADNGVWIRQIHNRDGWQWIDDNWYLYSNNTRLYDWQIPINDRYQRWFFLDPRLDGAMVTGIVTLPGGDTHEFAEDGAWIGRVYW